MAPASEGRAERVFGAPARPHRKNFERAVRSAPADRQVSPTGVGVWGRRAGIVDRGWQAVSGATPETTRGTRVLHAFIVMSGWIMTGWRRMCGLPETKNDGIEFLGKLIFLSHR